MTVPDMIPNSSTTPTEKRSGSGGTADHAAKSFIRPAVSPAHPGIK
jgi:hypothetical protein